MPEIHHARLRDLAETMARDNPRFASDAILILADALDQAARATGYPSADLEARNTAALARVLAEELRGVAPRHACPTRELLTAATAPDHLRREPRPAIPLIERT